MRIRFAMILSAIGLLSPLGAAQAQVDVTVTAGASVPAGYQQSRQPPPPPQPPTATQPVYVQPASVWQQAPVLAPAPAHTGFFMRFNIGGGLTGMRTGDGVDARVRGGGPLFSIALGGSIVPRLAVYGELWSSVAMSPTVEVGGSSGSADSLVVVALGAGITYYLPSNLYFGLTVGYGAASISSGGGGGSVGSTDSGLATKVTIGQEWFVGPEWGIGVAGVFGFALFPDGPVDWTVGSLGVALTITKN